MKIQYQSDQAALPPSPPPTYEPGYAFLEARPELLKNCLYSYAFLWTIDGRSYWMYPTGFDENTISGYVWNRPGWEYVRVEWQHIESFY